MLTVPTLLIAGGLALSGCGRLGVGTDEQVRLAAIEITPAPIRLGVGESVSLRGTGVWHDRTRLDLTPDLHWSSSTPGIANPIDPAYGEPGRIRGTAPGTAVITASYGPVSGTVEVHVTDAQPLALWIEPADVVLGVGDAIDIAVIAGWSDGQRSDVARQAIFTSSEPGVAEVREGVLQANGPGETWISARLGDAEASPIPVTVLEGAPTDVRIAGVTAANDAQRYVFHVEIGNGGVVGVPGVWLDLYTGDGPDLTQQGPVSKWIPYVPHQQVTTHTLVYEVPSTTRQTLTLLVDGDHVTNDAYRPNNTLGSALRDVASTVNGADLVVQQVRAGATSAGAFVATDILNRGSRASTGFYVDVFLDQLAPPTLGVSGDTWAKVEGLEGGGLAEADVVVQLEPDQCPFCRTWTTADSLRHVWELDENNNVGGPTGLVNSP